MIESLWYTLFVKLHKAIVAIEGIILISRKFELLVVSDVGQASRLSSLVVSDVGQASRLSSLVVSGYQQPTTNN
jgi:hypothetical protein